MEDVPKYSKIENILKFKNPFFPEAIVTEKLHGTNVRFGKIDNCLVVGSRKQIIYREGVENEEYDPKMDGYGFLSWFKNNVDFQKLPENTMFFGEFVGANIQKGVDYCQPHEKSLAIFDVKDLKTNEFYDFIKVNSLALTHNMLAVPVLATGLESFQELENLVSKNSEFALLHGKQSQMEGVVIRPAHEKKDHRGNRILAKYKNPNFAEKQKSPKVKAHSENFSKGNEYCTRARVENVIDKLRQETSDDLGKEHIPRLMKLFSQDVEENVPTEELPENKQERKQFFKGAQHNVVHFYEEWLAK